MGVHTIWANCGLFEGDGYSYFWGSNIDHKGFAESLRVVGLPILGMIIEEAIPQVPGKLLGNWDAVDDFFEVKTNGLLLRKRWMRN